MFYLASFTFSIGLFAAGVAMAGPIPVPDPDFGGPDGIARIDFGASADPQDHASAALVANGRLLLAGLANAGPAGPDIAFARLDTARGLPDASFGVGGEGRVLAGLAPVTILADVAAVSDGRLLFVGSTSNGVNVVGRRNADGSLDASFNGTGHRFLGASAFLDGATEALINQVVALPGGKILVTGFAGTNAAPAQACAVAARLNANGSTDTTFGAGRGSICVAPALQSSPLAGAFDSAVLADGRLILAGTALHPGGSGLDMAVVRLQSDGALDTTFGPAQDGWAYVAFDRGGTLHDAARAVAVDATGRIVLAGDFESPGNYDMGVARLLPNGDTDPAFGSNGQVPVAFDLGGHNYESAHSVHVLSGGHVLVGGQVQSNNIVGAAVMLMPNGQLDERFGDGGLFLQADIEGPESAIVVANRVLMDGDHLYMIGSSVNPTPLPGGGRNNDFAATRYLIPLFSDGFDGDAVD